jgi:hypothetical protein
MTGVAGTADVRLMNISLGYVFGCSELAEAIQYAIMEGADIINMSLGAPPHQLVAEAIQNALSTQGGIILVASAGNGKRRVSQDYGPIGAHYPAWYDGVIAVGGTDANGHLWSEPGQDIGSNYGVGLDLVAPAKDVPTITFSTLEQRRPDPGNLTGTSASAALVSGVAALLIGKYPDLTAAQVRSWLRATSTDITDPLGTGANLVGDDIYTGAGLVTASSAVTATEPDPVVADLYVERIGIDYWLNAGIMNAVPENPDLGITVQGSIAGTWALHYGVGDWPDTWIPISVPAAMSGAVDVPRTEAGGPGSSYIDVAGTHNGVATSLLNTEGLINRQVYTMRLTATDALGHTYTAHDWFMPVRAMLIFPVKNAPVPVRWGWPEIDGVVDTRNGATYSLSVAPAGGPPNPNWQLTGLTPIIGPLEVNRGANFVRLAVAPGTYPGIYPVFLTPPGGEGPHEVRLEVHSPDGNIEVDTQEIYIDDSAFALRPGFAVSTRPYAGASVRPRGIAAVDMDGSGQYRIFVHHQGSFLCLTPAGTVQWELPLFAVEDDIPARYPPAFLIEDLDGNGTKEIVVASYYPDGGPTPGPYGLYNEKFVLLLKPDGTLYNTNWPVSFPLTDYRFNSFGKVAAGDVDGDGIKEIIIFEYLGSSEAGRLHVMNLNGQALSGWPLEVAPGSGIDVPVVADVDADGKDEIVLDLRRNLYEDNGVSNPGWPPDDLTVSTHYWGGLQARELDGTPGLEIIEYGLATVNDEYRYVVDAREHSGARLPGNWPAALDVPVYRAETTSIGEWQSHTRIYVDTAQLISGGAPEIVVAYDKIQVLDTGGNRIAALPDIVLGGETRGLKIMDVDGDGVLEYVVLVLKYEDDDGWKMQAYSNLEAYELDGTPLAAADNRWPIRAAFEGWNTLALGNTITIEDIDGNGTHEVIHFLGHHPHRHWIDLNYFSRTGQMLPRKIEVLNIP